MPRILTLVALCLLPVTAQALPCRAPDAVRSWQIASASPLRYVAVYGSFAAAPPGHRFTGNRLTISGFTQPFSEPVTYVYTCPSGLDGCQTLIRAPDPPAGPILTFLEITDSGYVLTEQGCWSETVVPEPTRKDLADVARCARGGRCRPANP